jgi:hypothetical protein
MQALLRSSRLVALAFASALAGLLLVLGCHGGGGGGGAPGPAAPAGPPAIHSFEPAAGRPGTEVTLIGTRFQGVTEVTFAGVRASAFRVVSDRSLSATFPDGAGTGAIVVRGPGGPGMSSAPFILRNPADPVPVILSLSPTSARVGEVVSIRGTGFRHPVIVRFGGIAANLAEPPGDTQVRAVVPPAAVSGPVAVACGGGTGVSPDPFTVLPDRGPREPGPPAVQQCRPASGSPGAEITLTGERLTGVLEVGFNGHPAARVTYVNDREIRAVVPADAASGVLEVRTVRGVGQAPEPFQVIQPPREEPGAAAPAIARMEPVQGAPETQVRLFGSGFTGVRLVRMGPEAAAWTRVNGEQLLLTVPPGAASGPITVTTAAGSAVSADDFVVQAPPPPVITGFQPDRGLPGTLVTLTGRHFHGVTQAVFGGVLADPPEVENDHTLRVRVPEGAASSAIRLFTPNTEAESPTPFLALPPQPVLAGFQPRQGGVGTPVILEGTGLGADAQVTFSGAGPVPATLLAPGRITCQVPAGAATGPIRVAAGGAQLVSPEPFTVLPTPPSLCILLEGWYVTQAVQLPDRSVPLVAGRDGVLRVFLQANMDNQATPEVRVTITGGETGVHWQKTIPAPRSGVPTRMREESLATSWNLPVPGWVLVPGVSVRLEVDPSGRWPAVVPEARLLASPLAVRTVPPIHITLVPVIQANGAAGVVEGGGRTPDSWVQLFRRMFPVAELDVQVGAPLHSRANLDLQGDQGDHEWVRLMGELEERRQADHAFTRYYYGVVHLAGTGGTLGDTPVQSGVAAGWDGLGGPNNYQVTFAHEMGHSLGMAHAPCGVQTYPGTWPADQAHADAFLGAAGLDVETMEVKASPEFRDIMSYCPPYWISDYTYRFVLDYRERHPFHPGAGFR